MKTTIFILLISILASCCTEKNLYKKAIKTNTIEAYDDYLANYKNGKYAADVSQKIADIKFAKLRDSVFSSFIKIKADTTKLEDCITIKPSAKVLMGTYPFIELDKLLANTRITLHAYRKNWQGLLYSFACFKPDDKGKIQLNRNEPLWATYPGNDSLGIFWSMSKPTYKNDVLPFDIKKLESNTIYFFVESDGQIISQKELQLITKTPDVNSEQIRTKELVANLYYPQNKQNTPLVILLGGGEGGIGADDYAQIIASHGYAVLALAYFGMENLPKNMERIPVEYFFNAIDWVKEKQFIDSSRIVIMGGSKGGEAALLVASMRSDIKGVIAISPSSVRWQGLINGPLAFFFKKSSWTLNGKELHFQRNCYNAEEVSKFHTNTSQIELRQFFATILTDEKSKIEPAIINVEKINGPIMLIAGKDDKLWPSHYMCQMIEKRLDSLNFKQQVLGLYYDNAGHKICASELMPTIDYKHQQIALGGKDSENATAQIDSWNKMIRFLQTYFPLE
jgi:dienelactone hydrolase